jgi:hypothetical protein
MPQRGQAHAEPHVQLSPQRHPARRSIFALLQPHVQVAPAREPQVHAFVVVVLVMSRSSELR